MTGAGTVRPFPGTRGGKLRIAVISHIRHPIARPFMGGMEAHSHMLAGALASRGHDVTLFAAGDSRPPENVRLHPIVAEHYDRAFPWHQFHGTDALNDHLDASFAGIMPALREGGFDIIHNNSLHRYPPRQARRDRLPMLTSLHVPPFDALRRAVHASGAPWNRFTVCSDRQKDVWAEGRDDLPLDVVYNGIDTDAWAFGPEGDGTAIWFGRITPNKGTGDAVKAARFAGMPLRIYGPVEHRDYFEETVAPYLGPRIVYGGNLDPAELAQAVARASVCLFTPRWNEPFGLAAVEAMSCGVPVAAFDAGAVQEVVGPSGEIVPEGDAAALARATLRASKMDRQHIRDRAVRSFGIDAMIDRYEALYAECISQREADMPEPDFAAIELPPHGGATALAAE